MNHYNQDARSPNSHRSRVRMYTVSGLLRPGVLCANLRLSTESQSEVGANSSASAISHVAFALAAPLGRPEPRRRWPQLGRSSEDTLPRDRNAPPLLLGSCTCEHARRQLLKGRVALRPPRPLIQRPWALACTRGRTAKQPLLLHRVRRRRRTWRRVKELGGTHVDAPPRGDELGQLLQRKAKRAVPPDGEPAEAVRCARSPLERHG